MVALDVGYHDEGHVGQSFGGSRPEKKPGMPVGFLGGRGPYLPDCRLKTQLCQGWLFSS